ncbi:MAG: hypothetical protein IAC55_03395 [Tyzzerella sp.]|uniref:Uncharacterized protein n=1 Tax=Candidatus Fimicola merdigallinarum TaxID=2840819 RepID=A0A9D9DVC7_9FIRM|nr:hypothetical protein [Candidatus Fimicola merdigallinarum]
MNNKIYKRFPIKMWENECNDCCVLCDGFDICESSCSKEEITCNQCKYGEGYGE